MPAKSKAQKIAMCMALAARKGDLEVSKLKGAALEIYNSDMTNKEIEEFTVMESLSKFINKNMKNLNEFILESIKKQINIDDIDNNELKKFAEKVATYVSSRYYLDYPFGSDFVFHALSKLKGKELKLSVKDFDMYETDEAECLYCIPIRKYYDSDPRKGWLDI